MSLAHGLKGHRVAWFTDNQNVVSIVSSGSRVKELQSLALEIFELCVTNCISLERKWIARDLNTKADLMSRIIDFDDFVLTPGFLSLEQKQLTHLLKTGNTRIIGYCLRFP